MIIFVRLSGESMVVAGLVSGSGLERLVELSVSREARLDSDSTLVAVITAVIIVITLISSSSFFLYEDINLN